jgi:hypothetical protein
MTPDALIEHFGGVTATARALDVKPPSVSEWKKRGVVPIGRQYQAQLLSRGKLRAERKTREAA